MHENFIIAERYKSRDFMLFHFIFTVDYICDKNVLYGTIGITLYKINKLEFKSLRRVCGINLLQKARKPGIKFRTFNPYFWLNG